MNPNADLAVRIAKRLQEEGLAVKVHTVRRLTGLIMWELDKTPSIKGECLCPCHLPASIFEDKV